MLKFTDIFKIYSDHHINTPDGRSHTFIEGLPVDSENLTKHIQFGFADRNLNTTLPPRQTSEGRDQRKHLVSMGVLKDTGFETLSGIVIPFYEGDELVNLYSYSIGQRSKGQVSRVNDKGSFTIGGGSKVLLTDDPMNAIILVGLGLHHDYTIHCCFDFSDLPDDGLHTIGKLHIPKPHSRVAVKTKLLEFVNRGGTREELIELIDSSKPIQGEVINTHPDQSQPAEGVTYDGKHYYTSIGSHHYRITGLERNAGYHSLKITLKLWEDDIYFIDVIDLVMDKQKVRYASRAAEELGLEEAQIKRDLGKLLLVVESIQEKRFAETKVKPEITLSENEINEAVGYLKDPNLIQNIQRDFDNCGMVGEEINRLVGYIAGTSRLLDSPLSLICQSSSSAGKTTLQKGVMKLFPDESKVSYSALTSQSLYYLGETSLDQKVLSIAEDTGNKASYALKLLLSEGELSIASTGKDPETGATTTLHHTVSGKVSLFLTTTEVEFSDEELQNRCLVLTVDESSTQTSLIHKQQRFARTMQGVIQRKQAKKIQSLHHNVQRVLKPYVIVNPFINDLTFNNLATKMRRSNDQYLSLIEAVTLLNQYQRRVVTKEVNDDVIEALVVDEKDIELANQLASHVFKTALDDLPSHTRNVWDKIRFHIVTESKKLGDSWFNITFTRREVRELTGLSLTTLKTHISRLVDAECICSVTGDHKSKFVYQLLIDPNQTEEFEPLQVCIVIILAILLSLLATVFPSYRAAVVQPAEALRYE